MQSHLTKPRPVWACWLLALVLMFVACSRQESDIPYLKRRASFKTKLIKEGPTSGGTEPEMYAGDWQIPPERIQEVTFPSGNLTLKAWVYKPEEALTRKPPALVYLHAASAFYAGAMRNCKPFIDAGFVVMTPTRRGANGNPGYYELYMGEVDDAKAAVRWLAEQPYVDRNRIYAFGWSSGGGISTLLSLMEEVPVKHSGSSGGLYPPSVFDKWKTVPFDTTDPKEKQMRTLVGNIRWMQHKHYAFIESVNNETFLTSIAAAKQEMDKGKSWLEIIMVPGDHFTAFPKASEKYLELIKQESAAGLKDGERE